MAHFPRVFPAAFHDLLRILTARATRMRWMMVPRVLVVDDEPHITDLVTTAFRYDGFEAEQVMSGQAALSSIASDPPDLVVLDVMLPDLDGFEVTRRLRSGGGAGTGAVPHGPGRDGGQDQRPHRRRRRLPEQALQPGGADRPGPGDPAPHQPGRATPPPPISSTSPTWSSTRTPSRSGGPSSPSTSPRPSSGCCGISC